STANIPAYHGTDRLLDVASGHALGRIGRAAAAEDETDRAASCLQPPSVRRLLQLSQSSGSYSPAKATLRGPHGVPSATLAAMAGPPRSGTHRRPRSQDRVRAHRPRGTPQLLLQPSPELTSPTSGRPYQLPRG